MSEQLIVFARRAFQAAFAFIGSAMLIACSSVSPQLSNERIAELLASSDRMPADRANDERRKPDKMLAFIGVRPGMRVLDLGAGGGYSTELLARAVGAEGRVYAQNSVMAPAAKGRFLDRIKNPANRNVTLHEHAYDSPVPPEISPGALDMVTFFFVYHDQGNPAVDRARMNKAVYEALKPGGFYVIADHAGRAGTGFSEWNTLHRVEEAALRREVESAGFRLVDAADFLRNPKDARDKIVFKPAQPNDEFVLKFVKPAN